MINTITRSATLIISGCLMITAFAYAGNQLEQSKVYKKLTEGSYTYKIRFPKQALATVIKHSGYAASSNNREMIIKNSRLTLRNNELGKTVSTGDIQVVSDDTIIFIAREKLRFSPDSEGTSITFDKFKSNDDGNTQIVVFTGRWLSFFGIRICPGQVVNLPGESQCV